MTSITGTTNPIVLAFIANWSINFNI